jgi:YidC/Oxa1 family membrane protein insertase
MEGMIQSLKKNPRHPTKPPEDDSMDLQRFLLIAASAAITLLLLVEWTAFRAENQEPIERQRLSKTSLEGSLPTGGTIELSDQNAADELPSATLENTPQQPTEASDSSRFVSVKTDVLEVVIDLVGGDVVETALLAYPENIETPNIPFVLLEQGDQRTYTAQSGLVGPDGIDSESRALFAVAKSRYEMTPNTPLEIALLFETIDSVVVTKRFAFEPGSYAIDVSYDIENNSENTWRAVPFAQIKRDSTAPPDADTSGFGMQPFLGAATTTAEDRFKKFTFNDMADDPWKAQVIGGWIAMIQHYFVSAWVPNKDDTHSYSARQTNSGLNIAGFTSPALLVGAGERGSWSATLYAGPKNQPALAALATHLDLVVDYGWLWWIAQPLFWLLTTIQSVVVNWGLAIIVLTLLVKAAFFQLSAASYRSMAKMRKVQPKMVAIREQYAEDKQKQSQAMMELYKKEKINPMGGCLPILIQMPVFIALYWVLMESVELRQAPFALWIDDLSAMDPYFVLPLIMGASMFFMQKLNPPPPDPMQAKIMQWLPVVFTFFFLWFPSGLVLYWVVNNLLSMAQQYVITRQIEREGLAR